MLRRVLIVALVLCAMLCTLRTGALAEDSDTYYIEVDLANQITTVYRSADGSIVRQMICSTGTGATTPSGTFRLTKSRDTDRKEWYYISEYRCFVKYPTRIQGHILFHSIPYAQKDMGTIDTEAAEMLGRQASHGCVRLRWQDAKWIATHCPDDTATRIFTGTARKAALRALLLRGSYTGASGMTYEEFISVDGGNSVPSSTTLGTTGDEVALLQRRLGALGYYNGPVTGEYDGPTVAAVIRFQSAMGLWTTGAADRALLQMIDTRLNGYRTQTASGRYLNY